MVAYMILLALVFAVHFSRLLERIEDQIAGLRIEIQALREVFRD